MVSSCRRLPVVMAACGSRTGRRAEFLARCGGAPNFERERRCVLLYSQASDYHSEVADTFHEAVPVAEDQGRRTSVPGAVRRPPARHRKNDERPNGVSIGTLLVDDRTARMTLAAVVYESPTFREGLDDGATDLCRQVAPTVEEKAPRRFVARHFSEAPTVLRGEASGASPAGSSAKP